MDSPENFHKLRSVPQGRHRQTKLLEAADWCQSLHICCNLALGQSLQWACSANTTYRHKSLVSAWTTPIRTCMNRDVLNSPYSYFPSQVSA